MNSTQLNRLLKKKGWTGKEVGQLFFSSLFNDIKQQGNEKKELLFSQSDFEKIESTLTSDRDFIVYGVYRDLYSSIIDSLNRGQGLYQQFYNGFSRLLLELREIQHTEYAQKSIDNTPLTDEELGNMTYEIFTGLLLKIDWKQYPDQTARLERKAERQEQAKKGKKRQSNRGLGLMATRFFLKKGG